MAAPNVSTDLPQGQERQHRTLIATAVNDLIRVRPPHDTTEAEIDAGVTPVNYAYAPGDVRRYGAKFDNATDDTAAIQAAINVASQGVAGSAGETVSLPQGTAIISSQITIPNNVRFRGVNKNGSILKASGSWNSGTYPFMLLATNGSSSMFDSLLEDLTLDANDVSGLGCVRSDAWQENSGPRRCLFYRYRTNAVFYSQTGYSSSGGAAFNKHEDCEYFGSTSGASSAINVEQISAVGSFVLDVKDSTLAGTPAASMSKGIDIAKDSSVLSMVHFEYCTSGIYIDGVGSHTIINCTGGPSVTNLVEIASTFTGKLTMINCRRASATNFLKDNRAGGLGTITGRDMAILTIGSTDQAVTADNATHAWCVFDGTVAGTNAPTKGFNVTSVTRNAQGDYTVTFTNLLRNANAAISVSTNLDTADGWWFSDQGFGLGTANFTIRRGGAFAGAKVDTSRISVIVAGLGT